MEIKSFGTIEIRNIFFKKTACNLLLLLMIYSAFYDKSRLISATFIRFGHSLSCLHFYVFGCCSCYYYYILIWHRMNAKIDSNSANASTFDWIVAATSKATDCLHCFNWRAFFSALSIIFVY